MLKKISKRLRVSLILLLIFGVIILSLPYAIKYGVQQGLLASGVSIAEIEGVDFNPFTGHLVLNNVKVQRAEKPELIAQQLNLVIDWLPLFNKRIFISSLSLDGVFLELEQLADKKVRIAGIDLPDASEGNSPDSQSEWGVGLNQLSLVNSSIQIKSPEQQTTVKINDLTLTHVFSWDKVESGSFSFNTDINGAHTTGQLALDLFAKKPSIKGKVKIKELELANYQLLVGDLVDKLQGKLSLDIAFQLTLPESGVEYSQSGSIQLSNLSIVNDSIQIDQQQSEWQGELNYSQLEEETKLFVEGKLVAKGIKAQNSQTQMTLLRVNSLLLEELTVKQAKDIKLSNIEVKGLLLAQKESAALLTTEAIQVASLQLSNKTDVEVGSILVNGLKSELDFNQRGELTLLDALLASTKTTTSNSGEVGVEKEETTEEPVKIKIKSIEIGGDSQLNVLARTENGVVKKLVQIDQLELGELNNQTPKKLTPLNIEATINVLSKLSLKAKIAPFSSKVNTRAELKLKAFELYEFSPLIRKELGYNIESGQLNADINMSVEEDMLDGVNKLKINGLVMKPADTDKMAEMTSQLSMPLDSALSLLRDSDDNIALEIPIKGNLAEPDLDISGVINTALGSALQGTAKNVLKYALQPYGLIYMAAEKTYGAATAINLEAIEFEPANASVSKDSTAYIQKIAGLLSKRPSLKLRLCGVAVPADKLALIKKGEQSAKQKQDKPLEITDEQLTALAHERVMSIKKALASDYKIEADRLFTCLPKIETETTKPRVDISI